jgi:signal transduction histidine kinase
MNVQPTDINHVIEQCLLLVRANLKIASIEVHSNLAEKLPRLPCDPSQIEQVLLAVIVNASDAMQKGGNLWIDSRLLGDGQAAVVIRDDGSGISADILPKIFEPFVTTKDLNHGTGLGLAVSRGIIERHGGKIAVASEAGKGTTVTITLPVPGGSGPIPEQTPEHAQTTAR